MATTTRKKKVYKIVFLNSGKLYEIYAKSVSQGELFGFVEVEGLLFGEKTAVVVDPSEESLQREFAGVDRTALAPGSTTATRCWWSPGPSPAPARTVPSATSRTIT